MMRAPRRPRLLLLMILAVALGPAAGAAGDTAGDPARAAAGHSRMNHMIGLELGFALIPFGFEDPYSSPIGLSLFYELHSFFPSIPVFAGFLASYYDFNPLNIHFGESYMIQFGLYLGYDFLFPFTETSFLSVSPYAGYKHYFREHIFWSDRILTNRPILMAGVRVDLHVSRRFFFGVGLEYDLILDRSPINTLLHTDRIGLSF